MISLFQLWNLDDWDQRISFIFKGNFIGWKYLGFCFGFFYKFQTINFCIFSTKMDWDIIIRQLDFFFLQVNITECTFNCVWCSCKFCEHIFLFCLWTHSFHVKILVINIKYRHIQYNHSLKNQCQMWIHINILVRCEYTSLLAIKWPLVIKQPPPFFFQIFFFLSLAKAWQHANS